MEKFKTGDRVIYNGNFEAYVLRYLTDDMVDIRLWSGSRHIGDVIIHESDLTSEEPYNYENDMVEVMEVEEK